MKILNDFVKVYDSVFSSEFCNELIKRYEQQVDNKRMSDYSWQKDYRCFEELNIRASKEFEDLMPYYYNRIADVYEHYKMAVKEDFLPLKYSFEDARLKKYKNNGHDQFGWHTDVGDKLSSSRFLVLFTYLNDVKEGGETAFGKDDSNFEFTINAKCGRIVLFPPTWMFPHKGMKPISNDKYILSTYLHYV